jgi:hypothetical protein
VLILYCKGEIMADKATNNNDDIGKYARHPRRTAAGAMIIGTALGAGMMAAKKQAEKTPMQKMMDRFNHR